MWLEIILALLALLAYFYWSNTRRYGSFAAKGIFEPKKKFPFGTECSSW